MLTIAEARHKVATGEQVLLVIVRGRTHLFEEDQMDEAEALAAKHHVKVLDYETGDYA